MQAKQIKALLLTGNTDKYHNTEVTSSYLIAILNNDEIFDIDTLCIPKNENKLKNFNPDFSKYEVVIFNINIEDWAKETKQDFEEYVINGGGVVIIHEADNAFPNWLAYNKITALGGWRGRDEKSGPYYYMDQGVFIKDYQPGSAGTHGERAPYLITIQDTEHPITKGLPKQWLHTNDELYGNLRGPADNITVLASAYSDKTTGGTGKEEPVLFTISYGKGRIFHSVIGHTSQDYCESVKDLGFQITFSRGTEWAATGKVKQPKPNTFSTKNETKYRNIDQLNN